MAWRAAKISIEDLREITNSIDKLKKYHIWWIQTIKQTHQGMISQMIVESEMKEISLTWIEQAEQEGQK